MSLLVEGAGLRVESSTAPTRHVRAAPLSSLRVTGVAAWYCVEEEGADVVTVDLDMVEDEPCTSRLIDGPVDWVESMTGPTRNIVLLLSCTDTVALGVELTTDLDLGAESGHDIAAGPTLHICVADTLALAAVCL